jgi:hypothetical protein
MVLRRRDVKRSSLFWMWVSSIVGSEVPKTECACDKMFKLLDRGGCGFLLHCGPKTRREGDIVQRRRSGGLGLNKVVRRLKEKV